MYLLAVRSIFRKGNISSVKDINEQFATEGTVLYNFVKMSLIYIIKPHHKPSNFTQILKCAIPVVCINK